MFNLLFIFFFFFFSCTSQFFSSYVYFSCFVHFRSVSFFWRRPRFCYFFTYIFFRISFVAYIFNLFIVVKLSFSVCLTVFFWVFARVNFLFPFSKLLWVLSVLSLSWSYIQFFAFFSSVFYVILFCTLYCVVHSFCQLYFAFLNFCPSYRWNLYIKRVYYGFFFLFSSYRSSPSHFFQKKYLIILLAF